MGSDRDVASDFQLIAGTNRDLAVAVREERCREDLLARRLNRRGPPEKASFTIWHSFRRDPPRYLRPLLDVRFGGAFIG